MAIFDQIWNKINTDATFWTTSTKTWILQLPFLNSALTVFKPNCTDDKKEKTKRNLRNSEPRLSAAYVKLKNHCRVWEISFLYRPLESWNECDSQSCNWFWQVIKTLYVFPRSMQNLSPDKLHCTFLPKCQAANIGLIFILLIFFVSACLWARGGGEGGGVDIVAIVVHLFLVSFIVY